MVQDMDKTWTRGGEGVVGCPRAEIYLLGGRGRAPGRYPRQR